MADVDFVNVYAVNIRGVMVQDEAKTVAKATKLVSDGTTHAVAILGKGARRWRARCGASFMIEGDPLPAVARHVDCMLCIAVNDETPAYPLQEAA
jgi:hypothetical protein